MIDEIIRAARRSPGIEFESSLRLQVGTQIHISASYLNLARIFVVAVSSGASRHEQIEVNSKEATNMEGSLITLLFKLPESSHKSPKSWRS